MNDLKLIILLLFISLTAYAQNIDYEVINSNTRSIVQENLLKLETLADFSPGFPSTWIKSYASVEITIKSNGTEFTSIGDAFDLIDNQKSLLASADLGSVIMVDVIYYPNYTSINNELKKIHTEYTVIPYKEAEYTGGYELLKKYIKVNAIDKIPESAASNIQSATLSFIVDKEGQITRVKMTQSSGDEDLDKLLYDSLVNMPNWIPAKNAFDLNVDQEFVLRVGSLIGC